MGGGGRWKKLSVEFGTDKWKETKTLEAGSTLSRRTNRSGPRGRRGERLNDPRSKPCLQHFSLPKLPLLERGKRRPIKPLLPCDRQPLAWRVVSPSTSRVSHLIASSSELLALDFCPGIFFPNFLSLCCTPPSPILLNSPFVFLLDPEFFSKENSEDAGVRLTGG